MSLQVWLPFTDGTLKQQGLSDITFKNSNTSNIVVDTNGKLGKCYKRTTLKTSGHIASNTKINLNNNISMCCWAKVTECVGNTANGLVTNHSHSDKTGFGITVKQISADDYRISCNTGSGTDRTFYTYYGTTNIKNSWHHLALTYNNLTHKLNLYVDGNCEYTGDYTNAPKEDYIWIFDWSTSYDSTEYRPACSLNDVRIYDHCLSPMEVKEISKGLVLHYPLNRQGWGQENLILNSNTFAVGSGATGITPSTTAEGYHQVIVASGNSNWHASWATSTAISLLENTFAEGDPFTISFTIKSENANVTRPPNIYVKSGMGYYSMQGKVTSEWSTIYYSGTWKDTNAIAFHLGFAGLVGTYLFKNWKVEKGSIPTPWCPNSADALAGTIGLNGTTEYDCSGFCNNGIQNNSPTYSSDTAKYNVSTHLDGVNQTIQLPNLLTLIPDSIFTFNIWFKRLQSEPSSKPWETLFGGPSGFEIETCSANSVHDNKIKAYSWGGGTIEFEFDKWNMLTMVSNGTNALFYLNGELKLTGTYKNLVSGNYFIGSWSNTATQNYKGYVCDARIYATALSADDVLSLYQNSAYIDSNGNVYGAVHSEV